jgi:hypothetical protein
VTIYRCQNLAIWDESTLIWSTLDDGGIFYLFNTSHCGGGRRGSRVGDSVVFGRRRKLYSNTGHKGTKAQGTGYRAQGTGHTKLYSNTGHKGKGHGVPGPGMEGLRGRTVAD